jgi:hypothetical protein
MPAKNGTDTVITDGQFDWSGGVSSQRVSTIQSPAVPNGLARNQLSWLINGSVRDAGISPRWGWLDLGKVHPGAALFQGALLYEPDNANPYWLASIGGHIWKIDPDNATATVDLSAAFNLFNPSGIEQAFFVQGEEFAVIQAGDNATLPLFWDGALLRRSNGIVGNTDPTQGPINELPPGTAMEYFMGRIWYAQGRKYSAGDIVDGSNGTSAYNFRDAVLKVTENPLAIGGDGFTVPSNAGNIRALKSSANLNTATGQGQLYVFTRKEVYALQVPVTRADWVNATEPFQTVVQEDNGSVNDVSVVAVNGDLFYQSLDPAIRTLIIAMRQFGQWANPPISANVNRVVKANDRALMHMASGIHFDERMYQTALPVRTSVGIVHNALAVLDFDPLASFEEQLGEQANFPVWEGVYQGLQFIRLGTADFGGRQRAFAFVLSEVDSTIHLWELTDYSQFEDSDKRITMIVEFPAFTWQLENRLKKLVAGELWIDRLYGETIFTAEYRPDGDTCWHLWNEWIECTARNSNEDFFNLNAYPPINYGSSYRAMMALPLPQPEQAVATNRPTNVGYQMQVRLTIKGFCRIRGLVLHAELVEKKLYQSLAQSRLTQVSNFGIT